MRLYSAANSIIINDNKFESVGKLEINCVHLWAQDISMGQYCARLWT
jgi:hypothetical protein